MTGIARGVVLRLPMARPYARHAAGGPQFFRYGGFRAYGRLAGMLAYITFIPAIVFLVTAPYNKSRFIRFHSFQSIFLFVAVVIIQVALTFLTVVPFLILLTAPLHMLVALGALIVWIIMLMKANQGQMYKLPVIGDMAEKQV